MGKVFHEMIEMRGWGLASGGSRSGCVKVVLEWKADVRRDMYVDR